MDVTRQVDINCVKWTDDQPVVMSWNAFGSTFAVWIIIFLCVFKGVGSSSYIVWATVPLPVCFVLIMIINGSTLDGASDGIKKYFSGGTDEDGKVILTTAAMQWSDAAGQIFLGLSVCLGIMTSYGSYNDKKKPIILDSVIISVCNCSFSFIAGFAVWSVVGYLEKAKLMHKTKTSGVGLAFISYPTAIDKMSVPNLWAFLLGLTLFMLGIDSSFSAIEATSTVICDTAWGGVVPRMFVAFVLCVIGFLGSIPFCFNWGFTLFDVVDHYLCAYLLLLIGIL
jgi:SNF family Na+-dependent transporter